MTIYVSFIGMERLDNQRFVNEELNKWIEENVPVERRNYAKWGNPKNTKSYLAGMHLTSEQATVYKLKFEQ